ncbi:MAG: ImmA/IrrE family metallo-endopeptidase [Isosphaeraceae bacterium]
MLRRQWIGPAADVDSLERELLDFFGVHSIDDIRPVPPAAVARMPAPHTSMSPSQLAWLCRVRRLASTFQVSPFKDDRFDVMLSQLRPLASGGQEARRIPGLLADYGIRFLVVEHLPRTRIDGAALWLDDESPVVAVSIRLDRIDSFWHTLAHELGHIDRQDFRDSAGIDDDIAGDAVSPEERSECEIGADEFARNLLVPRQEIESFIARVGPMDSKAKIDQFANKIRVHPAIIISQLRRRGEIKYSHGREMPVKIRDMITDSALTDGWGFCPTQSAGPSRRPAIGSG